MDEATRFRVNRPRVVHETLDGEVVAIDLRTGTYYSLASSGAAVWEAIERGLSIREVVDLLTRRYSAAATELEASITGLVEELRAEELIVPGDGLVGEPTVAVEAGEEGGEPFEPPKLAKFEDMQDLILLDPVHEVDEEAGWPHARDDQD